MPSKNDITNDPIQTKAFTSAYSQGWDNIYMKTPEEWSLIYGQNLQNLDESKEQFLGTKMTRKQFQTLFNNE